MSKNVSTRGLLLLTVAVVIGLGAGATRTDARMTVMYDEVPSVQALTSPQPDGSPGLSDANDGLFQQLPAALVLAANRQVEKLTGGAGTTVTPTIRGRSAVDLVALFRARVDIAGARLLFLDLGLGPGSDDFAGADSVNLDAALGALASTPFAGGGTYADRVHMYVGPQLAIADPVTWRSFWHAMSLAGGVWFEAYHGAVQWSPEHWLAWPRVLRDGLVARGVDPTRIHVIVRGPNQAAVWANMRLGAACDLLANGPGAYRIEDRVGFVREFRATFGTAPAPSGPSAVTCGPLPVLTEPRATHLADVLELERMGASVPREALSTPRVPVGKPTVLRIALGADPLGVAAKLGAAAPTFWQDALARLTVTGPDINANAPIGPDGSTSLTLTPTAKGAINLALTVDGAAVRKAIGPPVDLAVTLAAHRGRVGRTLDRMIAQPTSWQFTIPLTSVAKAGPMPPRLSLRILTRRVPPKRSMVELRLARPGKRVLVELGVIRNGRFDVIRKLRITGTRAAVLVRIPPGVRLRARLAAEWLTRPDM